MSFETIVESCNVWERVVTLVMNIQEFFCIDDAAQPLVGVKSSVLPLNPKRMGHSSLNIDVPGPAFSCGLVGVEEGKIYFF